MYANEGHCNCGMACKVPKQAKASSLTKGQDKAAVIHLLSMLQMLNKYLVRVCLLLKVEEFLYYCEK